VTSHSERMAVTMNLLRRCFMPDLHLRFPSHPTALPFSTDSKNTSH